MSKKSDTSKIDTDIAIPPRSTMMLLVRTLVDTTWRMFLPTVAGITAGIFADSYFQSAPLYIVIGSLIGLLISVALVAKQLRRISKDA